MNKDRCVAARRMARRGFTLLEMLTVMTIIMVLVGVVIGISREASRRSAVARAEADMEIIKNALEAYRIQHGAYLYPGTDAPVQMTAAVMNPLAILVPDLPRQDPFGQPYRYTRRAEFRFMYELRSAGPSGTLNNHDDIVNTVGSP